MDKGLRGKSYVPADKQDSILSLKLNVPHALCDDQPTRQCQAHLSKTTKINVWCQIKFPLIKEVETE